MSLAGALLFTLSLSCCSSANSYRLAVPFKVDGAIYLQFEGKSLSKSRNRRLLLFRDGHEVALHNFHELTGYVKISSPVEALSYVRLLGSPVTERCSFERRGLELLDRSELSLAYVYGNQEYFEACEKSHSPAYGLVDSQFIKDESAQEASVQGLDEHWIIQRTLFFADRGAMMAVDVREDVWSDGRYSRSELNMRRAHRPEWQVFQVP